MCVCVCVCVCVLALGLSADIIRDAEDAADMCVCARARALSYVQSVIDRYI